jgi:regulator of sigma E protease
MLVIQALFAFIIVIGILVTVHEFGHYWVARRLGVKILKFSVGFGRPLWSRRFGKDNTEFAIAAIPLGGYVKMLDEREGEVAAEELHRAFNKQPLRVRSAIVFAGPLFNFLFAIIAYTMMYMVGVTGMKAIVGEVTPQSLAEQAGFVSGYQIVAVNEQSATRWDSVMETSLQELLDNKQQLVYSIKDQYNRHYDLTIPVNNLTIDDIAEGQFFEKIGFQPFRPPWPAIIGEIMPNSAAEKAGLQYGDKIISMDNQPVKDWQAWAKYITNNPDKNINTIIERDQQQIELILKPDNINGKGRMGVYAPYYVTESYSLWPAFINGINKTWDMSVLTLSLMAKMLTLQISHEHISGPISIAEYAGKSAQLGFNVFLSFLAIVSVSLGIINLLPIPLLDGGHLFFYFIEWIKGSPVTETTEILLQQIGLILLLSLMGLAIFNDLQRIFL